MADEYCGKCLMKLRPIGKAGAKECPRCYGSTPPKGPEHVETDFVLTEFAAIPKEAIVTPGVGIYKATTREHEVQLDDKILGKVQSCLMCSATMEVGCGKVCPNCDWVSPCDF